MVGEFVQVAEASGVSGRGGNSNVGKKSGKGAWDCLRDASDADFKLQIKLPFQRE